MCTVNVNFRTSPNRPRHAHTHTHIHWYTHTHTLSSHILRRFEFDLFFTRTAFPTGRVVYLRVCRWSIVAVLPNSRRNRNRRSSSTHFCYAFGFRPTKPTGSQRMTLQPADATLLETRRTTTTIHSAFRSFCS